MNTLRKITQNHFFVCFFVLAVPYIFYLLTADFIRESEINSRVGWFLLLSLGFTGSRLLTKFNQTIPKFIQLFGQVILLSLALGGGVDIAYSYVFSSVFTTDAMMALVLTDSSELSGFLNNYYSWGCFFSITFYALTSIFLILKLKIAKTRFKLKIVALGGYLLILAFLIQQINYWSRFTDVVPGFIGISIDFPKFYASIKQNVSQRQEYFDKAHYTAKINKTNISQTYVIIIGESLTKNSLHLYGYPRATTPFLSELNQSDKVLIFIDVVTPFAQTAPALNYALSSLDSQIDDKIILKPSIVGLLKKAGFKLWWISNQQPLRYPTEALSKLADKAVFISQDFYGKESFRYDTYLLPKIKQALADPTPHKVIFIHTLGSHLPYESHYPKEFAVFNDQNPPTNLQNLSNSNKEDINHYDNTVVFTDYFLKNVHSLLINDDSNEVKSWLFVPDHGEEVFQNLKFKGHRPNNVSANMIEIPLILWANDKYRQNFNPYAKLKSNENSAFLLDDLFYLVQCMTDITSSEKNDVRGLCGNEPPLRTRVIYGKDYETQIKK